MSKHLIYVYLCLFTYSVAYLKLCIIIVSLFLCCHPKTTKTGRSSRTKSKTSPTPKVSCWALEGSPNAMRRSPTPTENYTQPKSSLKNPSTTNARDTNYSSRLKSINPSNINTSSNSSMPSRISRTSTSSSNTVATTPLKTCPNEEKD